MSTYEEEQTAVIACLLDHLRAVGRDDGPALLLVAERAGFKNRAALNGLRQMVHDGLIGEITNGYKLATANIPPAFLLRDLTAALTYDENQSIGL